MPKKFGFTLIELLVVISIIAILSLVGLVYYASFLKSFRDSRRQSDLKLIQSALEDFRADQFYYPYARVDACASDGKFRLGCSLTNTTGTKTYITTIPHDPTQTAADYSYLPSGASCADATPQNCLSYCLYGALELGGITSDPGCSPTSPYNLGVTRP